MGIFKGIAAHILSGRTVRIFLAVSFFTLSACGGGGGGSTPAGGGGSSYTVSVTTSGLTGSGLQLAIASGASTELLNITANGTTRFPTLLPEGTLYTVGIGSQPSGQSCTLGGSTFSTGISSDKTVSVSCTDVQSVGGTISGLSGDLTLKLNNTNNTTFSANGNFTFASQIAGGDFYAVTVGTQPAGQTCLVSNSAGQVAATSITNVSVNCTASTTGYLVGGYISGFSGLAVMNLNGVEEVARTYSGSFSFATPLSTGTPYTVTVPSVAPGYECQVVNGAGVIANSDYPFVDINCNEVVGVSISPEVNPDGAYLDSGETITLTLNGTEDMTLDTWDWNNIAFNSELNPGDSYEVTVKTPPAGDQCIVLNSVGTIEQGVTPVIGIDCVADTELLFTIGGAITNLTGSGLVLSLDGRETQNITSTDTSYVFANAQPNFTGHTVSIATQPTGQLCSVMNSSPWIFSGNIGNANIVCSPGPYTVGGYAAGVNASGLSIQLSGAEIVDLPLGGDFVFNTMLNDGMSFEVEIISQPQDQLCTFNYNSISFVSASKDNLIIDCKDINYSVGVHVGGYSSTTPLLLQLNGNEIIQATGNTSFSVNFIPEVFKTRLSDGAAYSVSIAGQPAGQICTLTNPTGSISSANASSTGAYCVSDPASAGPYNVSVTTSGLLGSGLTLQLNGADDLPVSVDSYASFASTLVDGSVYTVSVLTQPAAPLQHCEVVNGSGTIGAAHATNVSVQCGNSVQSLYSVNGSKWLNYVKNDGLSNVTATDTACDPALDTGGYSVCLNGGEFMKVSLPASITSCTNITASDNLNAFNWVCDESNGVSVVSTGLKTGVSLSDLVDFNQARFKANFVSILDTGVSFEQTQSAIWWDNPVLVNNTGEYIKSGDIVLVTGSVPASIEMLNNTAVLVEPGFAMTREVHASGRDFLWFEGNFDGAAGDALSWSGSRFSVAQNIQATFSAGSGVFISGGNNRLKNIVANNNGGTYGMYISGDYQLADAITTNSNAGSYGLYISTGNSSITNIEASDNNRGSGFYLRSSGNITLNNVTANANATDVLNASGLVIVSGAPQTGGHNISNLNAFGNRNSGIYIDNIKDSSISNLSARQNGERGIEISNGVNLSVNNLSTERNGDFGIRVSRVNNSSFDTLIASNNGLTSLLNNDTIGLDGVSIHQSSDLIINNITANNNARHGYAFDSSERIVSLNIIATNNGGSGVAQLASNSNDTQVIIGATSANNGSHGYEIVRMQNLNYSSIMSVNNGGDGIHSEIFVDNTTYSNVLNANNTGYGIWIGADYGHYTGLLNIGSNGLGDCKLGLGILDFTGITQGGNNNNNLTTECVLIDTSDATLSPLVDASSAVVGKIITQDFANGADDLSSGFSSFINIFDWDLFDNNQRAWGIDGAAAFASVDNQGACNAVGDTCRIWDWSVATTDVANSGVAAAYDVVALPTLSGVLSIDWATTLLATDQTYCDTNFPDSVWDGGETCTSTYLRHAQEIFNDSIGNENGLCESGETCLYMPNIGRYQGHGTLISAGTLGTGADTITLMKYDTLGR